MCFVTNFSYDYYIPNEYSGLHMQRQIKCEVKIIYIILLCHVFHCLLPSPFFFPFSLSLPAQVHYLDAEASRGGDGEIARVVAAQRGPARDAHWTPQAGQSQNTP